MSTNFLLSDNVYVTPIAKDRTANYNGKRLSEHTLTTLVRHLVDVDGFVISHQSDGGSMRVQFMLLGYFFDVLVPTSEDAYSNATNIYASITIEKDEIKGQDTNETPPRYNGLSITTEMPESGSAILKILSRNTTSDGWSSPSDSHIKFDLTRARIEGIDGKRSVIG